MWYRQSLAIGRSEGIIQCTYAIIYDAAGNKLFALQRKNFNIPDLYKNRVNDSDQREIVVNTGVGNEGIVSWSMDKRQGDEFVDTAYITFDMPLVIAKQYSEDRLVPVTLDYNAIDYIKSTLASAKKIQITHIFEYGELKKYNDAKQKGEQYELHEIESGTTSHLHSKGFRFDAKQNQWYRNDWKPCDSVTQLEYNPRWLALSQKLNDVDTFYVKPAAFDWQPTDLSNINAAHQDRVATAKKKLDRAKALLLASGITLTM